MSGPSPSSTDRNSRNPTAPQALPTFCCQGEAKPCRSQGPAHSHWITPRPEQGTIHTYLCITEAHQDKALLEFSSSNPFCYQD